MSGRLKTQEELMFLFKSEGRKKLMLQFKGNQARGSLLIQGGGGGGVNLSVIFGPSTVWMRPPTLRRAIWFTQPTNCNVNPKHVYRQVQNNIWPKSEHPINHHRHLRRFAFFAYSLLEILKSQMIMISDLEWTTEEKLIEESFSYTSNMCPKFLLSAVLYCLLNVDMLKSITKYFFNIYT